MIQRFGERNTFALELGAADETSADLRIVDVYAGGRWLTCDDNVVFLSQFIGSLNDDLNWLVTPATQKRDKLPFSALTPLANHKELLELANDDNELHLFHRFMDWGPTADNVSMHLFRINGVAYLPFSFWRETHHDAGELGTAFCAELPIHELLDTIHRAAWKLTWDWIGEHKRRGITM